MPYDPNDKQWREYHVTPRYLAGSTYTGDPALQPLLDAGWKMSSDEWGNVYVNAPDQSLRLGYLPESDDDTLWKITAYTDPFALPHWLVTFQESTPTEIVAGFTTALAATYTDGPGTYLHRFSTDLAALDAGTPLAAAGWSHQYTPANVSFRSPDGLAAVHLRRTPLSHTTEIRGDQERWLVLAGPPGRRWYATASSHTPALLVTALNTAITDPAPVIRYGQDLYRLPPEATATPLKPPVPTPLDVRRAQAATARSTLVSSPAGARPFIPAPPPPSAPQGPHPGRSR